MVRIEDLIQLCFRHKVAFQNKRFEVCTATKGFVDEFGGGVVAEVGIEGRGDSEGFFEELLAAFGIGEDVVDTEDAEHVEAVAKKGARVVEVFQNQGRHHIEFELTLHDGEFDGAIVALDLVGDHLCALSDGGIYFSWHDRGAGFDFGKDDFPDATDWAHIEQFEILGDALHGDGEVAERRGNRGEDVHVRGCLEEICRWFEWKIREFREVAGDEFLVLRMRVDARSKCGSAKADFK